MTTKSMTGFGAADFMLLDVPLSIEVRTLNHRFLDLNVKLPRFLTRLEPEIHRHIRERLHRGRVEVNVNIQSREGKQEPFLNLAVAEKYHDILVRMGRHFKLLKPSESPSLELLASFKDIYQEPESISSHKDLWDLFKSGLDQALDRLIVMREKEGKALESDLMNRLGELENLQLKVTQLASGANEKIQERLRARIEKILQQNQVKIELDEGRLLQEVALLAERGDISEELERLRSHLEQCNVKMKKNTPIGRELDFLAQEIYREINTVGSKAQNEEITHIVVAFKTELEKLREQIQNLE